MVYEPETKSQLRLREALYLALFPRNIQALEYGTYRPKEEGILGTLYNAVLSVLVAVNGLLTLLLTPLCFIAPVVSLPLLVPYWAYRRLFGQEDDLFHTPLGARIAAFPGQLLRWVLCIPVKIVQVITVLMAFSLGPRD